MRLAVLACAGLVVLVACGPAQRDDAAGTEPPASTVDETPPQPAGGDIRGLLAGDPQLEGGCAWIQTDDGTRYEVIYPEGYRVEMDPLRLVGPDGDVVAEEGDTLEVSGALAEDMVSVCQVGRIWRADSVALDPS